MSPMKLLLNQNHQTRKLIYLPKECKRKRKKSRKGRKSTWKDSKMDDLVDSFCSSEYAKKKLVFTNNKA